ncbi:hypothetical protein ES703_76464 [subsurface metagenome]
MKLYKKCGHQFDNSILFSIWFMISLAGVFMIGANVLIASQSTTDAIKKITIRDNEMEAAESLEQIDQITLHYQTYEKDRQGPVFFPPSLYSW